MTDRTRPDGSHVVFHKTVLTPLRQRIQAVLLYKRTQDAPIHPGYWALPGGTVDPKDKDEISALKRELIKEKEIQVKGLSQKAYGILLENTRSCADVWVNRDDGNKLIRYREATLDKELDSLGIGRNPKSKKEGRR